MRSILDSFQTNRLAARLGWVLVGAGLVLNIWVVEYLFAHDQKIEWPNNLYVVLFQAFLLLAGVAFWLAQKNIVAIENYVRTIELKKFALHIFFALIAIDLLLQLLFFITMNLPGYSQIGKLHSLFHLTIEKNVPSTFSALQLLMAGVVALYCAKLHAASPDSQNSAKWIWLAVSLILVYMSLDEYFSLHEDAEVILVHLNIIPQDYDNELGGLGYAWTIVGGVAVIAIGLPLLFAFIKIFSNCQYLLFLLILSGSIFVIGAIGMENLQVFIKRHYVDVDHRYFLMLEEFFEMLGVSLAIFVFLRFAGELKEAKP